MFKLHRKLPVLLVLATICLGIAGTLVAQAPQSQINPEMPNPRPPTFADPWANAPVVFTQFGGRLEMGDAPPEPSREMIAMTIWVLTIAHSAEPESDELIGKLVDKAVALPTVIGTANEVRDLVSRLQTADVLIKSRELRLATLDGFEVMSQTGAERPSVVGTNTSGRGRMNAINMRSVGTIIQATPTLSADAAILVKFNYQTSDLKKSKDVAIEDQGDGKITMADEVTTQQFGCQVRLKSGTALLLSSDSLQETDSEAAHPRTQLIVLTASVLPQLEEPQATGETRAIQPFSEPDLAAPEPEIAIEAIETEEN